MEKFTPMGKDPNTYHKKQEIPKEELEIFIQRIYDEDLASDMLGAGEVYTLIQLLCPKCPPKVIKNAKKNHSSKKADNILFHLVRAVPRLFTTRKKRGKMNPVFGSGQGIGHFTTE